MSSKLKRWAWKEMGRGAIWISGEEGEAGNDKAYEGNKNIFSVSGKNKL